MELPFDPVIPLLGIYPKKLETPIRKDKCIPMFTAAQFTIAKIWKQPKCPSADEWGGTGMRNQSMNSCMYMQNPQTQTIG